jgi:hypothetical protein
VSSQLIAQGQALRVAHASLDCSPETPVQRTRPAGKILLWPLHMKTTRIVYDVLYGPSPQRHPLSPGSPFTSLWAAQCEARKLAQRGYYGWIIRLREVRQEDWPEDQWLIDHSVDETMA